MPHPQHPPGTGEASLDPEITRQLRARRQLLLHGPLDTEAATRLAAELLTLEADGPEPITVSINSSGGELSALLSVTDTLQAMHAPVATRCLGQARGTAAALIAAGTGQRRAAPHAQLVLELPHTDASGSAADLDRAAHGEGALVEQLLDLMVRATGGARDDPARDWQQGRLLSAAEAVAEGLVDEVAG